MSPTSDLFEQQIKRIHSLIERDGASVTWNDRVVDPDNPARMRQIDVTVRIAGALTLIECRIHAEPQDVTWVEELIGRRASLGADAVIAVSASGFTKGAILKAAAFGIILRDLASLTEEEISAWGARTKITVHLHHFDNIALRFLFSADANGKVTVDDVERAIRDLTIELLPVLDLLVQKLRDIDETLPPVRLESRLTAKNELAVKDQRVLALEIAADVTHSTLALTTPAVVAYDKPDVAALERNTFVELVEQGKFEITQSSNCVAVAMDVSAIPRSVGTKLGKIAFEFSRAVEMREVNLLGNPMQDLGVHVENLHLMIDFV